MNSEFEPRYAAARADFLQAAERAGARLESHAHPLTGPEGEALAVDTAWVGPKDARQVLVTISGTHGVEGIYGSACQCHHLREVAATGLPEGQALLAIHALNPHGFAWLRRVDHENIDINRNHLDFGLPLPANPGYAEVDAMLERLTPTPEGMAAFEREMQTFLAREGRQGLFAVTGGQYTHPQGIFFGGQAPCWSQGVARHIAQRWLQQAAVITVLDHHTGLGPHGHTEIICRHPVGSASLDAARRWFGADVTSPDAGESASAVLDGNVRMAFEKWCSQARVVAVALEAGTVPDAQVLRALVADHWLHRRGDPRSPAAEPVRRQMRLAFCCEEAGWQQQVLARSMDLHAAALRGMAEAARQAVPQAAPGGWR